MKWDTKIMLRNQSKALNCIRKKARIGVSHNQKIKRSIRLIGTSGFDNGGEDGGGRVLPFARGDEPEEGLGMLVQTIGAEEVGHGAVGVEGVAEGGLRGPVEEGEERERRERVRVEVDEVDKVTGCEGREDTLERGLQRLCLGVVNCFGDGEEYGISMVRRWWWRVPGGG
ncbi:LOW QUALITY PROTEIN: hypothetical protein PanWU01x14_352260 [Parasponia andersonii]|uniref:Uncharacterized protein n=1 Tax=Parasponia andersonii TaxID=3476 RepID=A0A2P5AAE0_PARAD|nr:LOW QUALITY PROTEIN: hypothetical protein PanWU01x14_352260 [Parasponia andersonii]